MRPGRRPSVWRNRPVGEPGNRHHRRGGPDCREPAPRRIPPTKHRHGVVAGPSRHGPSARSAAPARPRETPVRLRRGLPAPPPTGMPATVGRPPPEPPAPRAARPDRRQGPEGRPASHSGGQASCGSPPSHQPHPAERQEPTPSLTRPMNVQPNVAAPATHAGKNRDQFRSSRQPKPAREPQALEGKSEVPCPAKRNRPGAVGALPPTSPRCDQIRSSARRSPRGGHGASGCAPRLRQSEFSLHRQRNHGSLLTPQRSSHSARLAAQPPGDGHRPARPDGGQSAKELQIGFQGDLPPDAAARVSQFSRHSPQQAQVVRRRHRQGIADPPQLRFGIQKPSHAPTQLPIAPHGSHPQPGPVFRL